MNLYEISATAYVKFYVEAESEEEALESDLVSDNTNPRWHGDFDWEHDETTARECEKEQSDFIRKRHPEQIAK